MANNDDRRVSPFDMCIGKDGQPLPYSPAQVNAIVRKLVDHGEILAVIARVEDEIGVQVFGPPSRELLGVLENATAAYRRVLKGRS